METIKRQCNVVMLSTNDKARIGEITSNLTMHDLFIMSDRVFKAWNTPYYNNTFDNSHLIGNNLYFTSEEEIREGDYYYSLTADAWFKQGRLSFTNPNERLCKKIIASTDPSLGLPQPSTSFIEKYISEYNKGNIIEKVNVEYDGDYDEYYGGYYADTVKPKVSKGNTISISKVKDSWSREEVIALIDEAYKLGYNSNHSEIPDLDEMNELSNWINKNL